MNYNFFERHPFEQKAFAQSFIPFENNSPHFKIFLCCVNRQILNKKNNKKINKKRNPYNGFNISSVFDF